MDDNYFISYACFLCVGHNDFIGQLLYYEQEIYMLECTFE